MAKVKKTKPAAPAQAKTKMRDSSVAPKRLPQNDKPKNETRVEIKPAKGRPMLTWVGKKPLRHAIAYPAQLVETFHATPPSALGKGDGGLGLLFHGDNKDVLAYLLANGFRGKVKLIYIDPPFDSGADYVRKVSFRGTKKSSELNGDGYGLGEQVQYTDIWANDNYLQFLYERLLLLKELLGDDGVVCLHSDWHKGHHLRSLLDEIFSSDNFANEIIWQKIRVVKAQSANFGNVHDTILVYRKSQNTIFNPQFKEHDPDYELKFDKIENTTGRRYQLVSLVQRGAGPARKFGSTVLEPGPDRHWIWSQQRIDEAMKSGLIEITSGGTPRKKQYLDESIGKMVDDTWVDIPPVNSQALEDTGFPTQKPEELLDRIISAFTNPSGIVLDCFLGSGTTAAVAQRLGRRWIGADINKGAIQTTIKRLQSVIQEQAETAKSKAQSLPGMEGEETLVPAQLGFAVYRVNDYDLQIQHNEAFNLAVEHLGMTRTKTDAFFDGTLGRKLVKIVPFNHPITPLDLEEVKRELNNRPDEERDIVVVGLGKEVAVEAWLEEWNKLRKQGSIPNRIEVIELRSDPKYGGFFTHEPAKAKVSFKRDKDKVEITIDDFISPTILKRLKQQNKDNPLFQPQVSDWRSMVDSVMIDSDYDGKVFNITLADVPERKNDLVEGKYVVEAKKGATVAVKVTDMLGEEVLVVKLI